MKKEKLEVIEQEQPATKSLADLIERTNAAHEEGEALTPEEIIGRPVHVRLVNIAAVDVAVIQAALNVTGELLFAYKHDFTVAEQVIYEAAREILSHAELEDAE